MAETERVAVVTGANRGLGLETCRQLAGKGIKVLLTSRDETKGKAALQSLGVSDGEVTYHSLDVTDDASIQRLVEFIGERFGRLDVLVNNAGVFLDKSEVGTSVFQATRSRLIQSMDTNVFGPLFLCQALVPMMRKHRYGRIVNVSSGMGQLSEMLGQWPAYRISKTALNAVTRILADELKDSNILINSVCPGWVRTDMGGADAERSVEEGAAGIVWLATMADGGPTGGFFRDKNLIPW